MINKIPISIDTRNAPEFEYPIKLLMNMRRSVAQRYQTIRHIPTVKDKEIDALITLYRHFYELEQSWRFFGHLPALTGLPKWATPVPEMYLDMQTME